MQYDATAMSPASNSCNFDHSYELPLRRNLLLLLLDLLRFVAGVLLDRVGFSSSCLGELQLPGQPWGGEHDDDDAALERFLEARLWWEAGMRSPSLTAPGYRRRVVALPGDDKLGAEDDGGGAAVCAICLVGLDRSGRVPDGGGAVRLLARVPRRMHRRLGRRQWRGDHHVPAVPRADVAHGVRGTGRGRAALALMPELSGQSFPVSSTNQPHAFLKKS